MDYFEKSLLEQMKTFRFWLTIVVASIAVVVFVVLWLAQP